METSHSGKYGVTAAQYGQGLYYTSINFLSVWSDLTQKAPGSLMPHSSTPSRRHAELMLILATLFWGWTFPVVKEAIAIIPIFAFLAIRFFLATLLMLPLTGLPKRRSAKTGLLLGGLLFAVFAFQTLGLAYTSASKCAFITGLNVIWVAAVTARNTRAWLAVGFALGGLWLLTEPQGGLTVGDLLTLVCSLFIAAHILVLDRLTSDSDSGQLAVIQFAVVAVLCAVVSFFFEENRLPDVWSGEIIFALLLTAIGATVFSFWAQTHFQRYTTPVRVGVIFILEPVFAALFAVLFYGERLSSTAWAGAGLVLMAMVITTMKRRA